MTSVHSACAAISAAAVAGLALWFSRGTLGRPLVAMRPLLGPLVAWSYRRAAIDCSGAGSRSRRDSA